MTYSLPLIDKARSEIRNATSSVTFSGRPGRQIGIPPRDIINSCQADSMLVLAYLASRSINPWAADISINPRATVLTRTPLETTSFEFTDLGNELRLSLNKAERNALRLVTEYNEPKFALFKEGPTILQVKSMEKGYRLLNPEAKASNLAKRLDKLESPYDYAKCGHSAHQIYRSYPIEMK